MAGEIEMGTGKRAMSDTPPLLFEVRFGALHPANTFAKAAVAACPPGPVRIEIKRTRSNERRRGFYWVMLDVAAEALTDATGFAWDQELLHDELKRRLKLGETFITPTGHQVFKPRSTSNRAMTEPERVRWLERCAAVLSNWLGVEVIALMNEARARNAGEGPPLQVAA
jgi:hypothetical protein